MTIATIGSTTTGTVTLTAGPDAATLIITGSGAIEAANPFTLQTAPTIGLQYDIINAGQIAGNISLAGSGTLQNSGTITGATAFLNGAALQNSAYIGTAVKLLYGTLANTGTIAGGVAAYYGGFSNGGVIAGGVKIDNDFFPSDTALNTGTITGGTYGISANDASLLNQGLINGAQAGFTGNDLTNQGIIIGGTLGANLHPTAGYADAALRNSGTIAGGYTGLSLTGNASVYDTGTISGSSYAILAGDSVLNLTLAGSAALYGAVRAAAGIAVLEGPLPNINPANLRGFTQIEYVTGTAITGFINTGTFSQHPSAGLSLASAGSLQNSGTIAATGTYRVIALQNADEAERYGGTGIIAGGVASFNNTGQINGVETGIALAAGGTILNAGTIAATGRYYRYTNYNGGAVTSTISHGPATALYNAAGTLYLTVTPGAEFLGAVANQPGAGTLSLDAGPTAGSLNIDSFSGFAFINFAANSTWTLEGSTSQLATSELISNFTYSDTIVLDNFVAQSAQYYSGLGLILNNGGSFPMLHFADGLTTFAITTDSENTTITAACFCRGTRIATPRGEVPVEDLAINDDILTLHAGIKKIKWIGRRSYAAPFSGGDFIRPIRLRPGAVDDDIPRRALNLSPGHALFIDGVLIPAWRLLNAASITQLPQPELVEYFHIELDAQEVIFAESCPVETFIGTQQRGQFHNADEFQRLYPNAEDQSPCLTLLEDGFALEAIKTRIAARAGLPPAPPAKPGPLRGFVDVIGPDTVEGWAQDENFPETPVALDVLRAEQRIGRILANRFRADLREAGLGTGCHAFHFPLPPGEGPLTVHRTTDATPLPLTDAAMQVAL